jgi:hypothetical protein
MGLPNTVFHHVEKIAAPFASRLAAATGVPTPLRSLTGQKLEGDFRKEPGVLIAKTVKSLSFLLCGGSFA